MPRTFLIDTDTASDDAVALIMALRAPDVILRRAVGGYSYQGGTDAAQVLLSGPVRPQAIFCANDVMAVAVMDVAAEAFGLRIPQDLSVAGFDDTARAMWPGYGLTSVDQNIDAMVEQAVAILLGRIADPKLAAERRLVTPELRVRGSTGRASRKPWISSTCSWRR